MFKLSFNSVILKAIINNMGFYYRASSGGKCKSNTKPFVEGCGFDDSELNDPDDKKMKTFLSSLIKMSQEAAHQNTYTLDKRGTQMNDKIDIFTKAGMKRKKRGILGYGHDSINPFEGNL